VTGSDRNNDCCGKPIARLSASLLPIYLIQINEKILKKNLLQVPVPIDRRRAISYNTPSGKGSLSRAESGMKETG
jgi:hypothetical protein